MNASNLIIAVLVAGCAGAKPSPAPAPVANTEPAAQPVAAGSDRKPTEAECAAAVDKAMSLLRADPEAGPMFDDARIAEKRADGMDRCARGEWTGHTVDCLMAATDARAIDTCVRGRTHSHSEFAP